MVLIETALVNKQNSETPRLRDSETPAKKFENPRRKVTQENENLGLGQNASEISRSEQTFPRP